MEAIEKAPISAGENIRFEAISDAFSPLLSLRQWLMQKPKNSARNFNKL
jgi:hypothetical protein